MMTELQVLKMFYFMRFVSLAFIVPILIEVTEKVYAAVYFVRHNIRRKSPESKTVSSGQTA